MKFIEGGPDIPNELLAAREEGKVIFFCGAGVSKAFVGLSDFVSLAAQVVDELGSLSGSRARQLLDAANTTLPSGEKVSVAVDKLFSSLDQEFEPSEVRNAVARALAPPDPNPNLAAHRMLLDLSTGIGGRARLVTTNFDLLFEACDARLDSRGPENLPRVDRLVDFEGIIHLHGKTNEFYTEISAHDVVLSSSDFGRAYLSDGWATNYIRGLMNKYKIVFVGYSADDPPVQYLLEALREDNSPVRNLYAFQAGDEARAREQWAQKGVTAIAYNAPNHNHSALWNTLSEWSHRARDPKKWHREILERGLDGPAALTSFQRGQIASVASDVVGAGKIASQMPKLPSTWLYVFDPEVRYLRPMRTDLSDPNSSAFDPFQHFGIDSDEQPKPVDLDDYFQKRDKPAGAWNAFMASESDAISLPLTGVGDFFDGVPVQGRVWQLTRWLLNSMDETPALWWAAGLARLRPDIVSVLERAVRYSRYAGSDASNYWRRLLKSWANSGQRDQQAIEIRELAQGDGWSPGLVRDAVNLFRPYISVARTTGCGPPMTIDAPIREYLKLDVEYPHPHFAFEFDKEHLPFAISFWRDLLVEAEQMENEIGAYLSLDTTRPDDGEVLDATAYGLTGPLRAFTHLMEALERADADAAAAEIAKWRDIEGTVFERLRIWAAGRPGMTSPSVAEATFTGLSDRKFWSFEHERDLLFAIRDRWSDLSPAARGALESRLLMGPIPFLADREADGDNADEIAATTASYRLSNIQWLINEGVAFSFDVDAEKGRLKGINPDWKEEYAEGSAQPMVSGVYSITTDTDAYPILDIPFNVLLPLEPGEKRPRDTVRYDRFVGYSEKRPAFAILAIHSALRRGVPIAGYWSSFFKAKPARKPSRRMLQVLATHLTALDSEDMSRIWYPLVDWISDHAGALEAADVYDCFWDAIVKSASSFPSGYKDKSDRDWSFEALNSVIGRLTRTLFSLSLPEETKAVPKQWLKRLEGVLALPDAHGRHALQIAARQINWLFHYEPSWTIAKIVERAKADPNDADAFWSGIIARGQVPQADLFALLKDDMLARIKKGETGARFLVPMALLEWGGTNGAQGIADQEMRDILVLSSDDTRVAALSSLTDWAGQTDEWASKIVPFLRSVWPRQRTVKTPAMAAALFSMASTRSEFLPEAMETIRERLVPLGRSDHLRLHTDLDDIELEGARSVVEALEILLAGERAEWPYDVATIIGVLNARRDSGAIDGLEELVRRAAEVLDA